MLTSIIKATRAHYAALQHRPSPDRARLMYQVTGYRLSDVLTSGSVWVKVRNKAGYISTGMRKREITRLLNRLQSMYPEAYEIGVDFE